MVLAFSGLALPAWQVGEDDEYLGVQSVLLRRKTYALYSIPNGSPCYRLTDHLADDTGSSCDAPLIRVLSHLIR